MGDKTSHLICQLDFQVWVWLTENNEGEKSISRSKKLPRVPRGNEIEPQVGLCRCGSSLLITKYKTWSCGRAHPCPKQTPTQPDGKQQAAVPVGQGGRQGGGRPCPSLRRGDSPAHSALQRAFVWTRTDGRQDAEVGDEKDVLKGE